MTSTQELFGGPKLRLTRHSWRSAETLQELVGWAQQGDPLAPVTIVGPSNYANLSLRHRMGLSGFANLRLLVFPRLSEFLGAPSLAAQGRRPLTPIVESASVRSVASRTSGILAGVRSHPATIQSLRNAFRELRSVPDSILALLESRDPLRKEIVDLYRAFQEETRDYYDREDLAWAAAGAVRSGNASGLADLGSILFFHIRSLSPGEKELAEALAAAERCAAVLELTGDPEADGPAESMAQDFSRFLGDPVRYGPVEKSTPRFLDPLGKTLLVAPAPHDEVRWVIRRIEERAEGGMPFHRMAVVYGSQDPYSTLIPEELQAAGIPVAGPSPSPLAMSPAGKTLTGLLNLAESDLPRGEFMSWLTGCPVRTPADQIAERFNPSHWDAISKKAGVVGGLARWRERLSNYASENESSAWRREAQGEISGAQAALMAAEAAAARQLLRFVQTLAEDLTPPQGESTWSLYSSWARGLLDRYLAPNSEMPVAEQPAAEKIIEILEELAGADDFDASPDPSAFAQALDEALQSSSGHLGAVGQGVFVGPISAAVGMSFDIIHFTGMIEGAAPAPARDDPLLPDGDKQAAGGLEAGLRLRAARMSEDRYAYLSALGSAPECTLSFPKASPAAQRGHYPSRWFLEQASVLEGSPVRASGLPRLANRPWLTVIESLARSLAPESVASPADLQEYNLKHLWSWRGAGRDPAAHPLAGLTLLEKSLRLSRDRYLNPGFTEWDGNLSAAVAGAGYVEKLDASVVSPTSLERWAGCPFSYFLASVLGLGSLDDPEEVLSITAMERGSLVHSIMEQFIGQAKDDRTLPRPGEPWSNEHRSSIERIALENFHRAELAGTAGKKLMWDLDKEDILNDLHSFLEADADLRRRFALSPSSVETRFGIPGGSWAEAVLELDEGAPVRFRGIIDRIDTDPQQREALVLDYKSGAATSYRGLADDPIDRGRKLQLAVYALAAQGALGPEVKVRSAYWFVSSRGGFSIVPPEPFDIRQGGSEDRVKEGIATIVSGIKGGLFPANPGSPDRGSFANCRYCDFDSLCPSQRDRQWERKKSHPLLADYVRLSEGEES